MAFHFAKGDPFIEELSDQSTYVLARKEDKAKYFKGYVQGRYTISKMTFDILMDTMKSVHIIKLLRDKWEKSSCTCCYFLKNYFCYHLVAVAVQQNLHTIPFEYCTQLFQMNKKRGRKPKIKAGQALVLPASSTENKRKAADSNVNQAKRTKK
jgi:hypothetical protein